MIRVSAIALLLMGCTTVPRTDAVRIDHVIIGAADLDSAMVEMEQLTGARSVIGGVHPGRGTRNALMSLGNGTYLEILAPDPSQSIDNQELRELRALTRPTPVGWAVSADDEAVLRSALASADIGATAAEPGSRALPDGSVLHWVTFGYSDLDNLLAPFFIVWAEPALHPSRTSPGGCRLSGLAIDSPQAAAISSAVAPLGLDVMVGAATRDSMRLTLSCAKGEVRL